MEEKILFQKNSSLTLNKKWEEVLESSKETEYQKIYQEFIKNQIKKINTDLINDREGLIQIFEFIGKDYKKSLYLFAEDIDSKDYATAFENMRTALLKRNRVSGVTRWVDSSLDKLVDSGAKLVSFMDEHNKFKNTCIAIGIAASVAVAGYLTTADLPKENKEEQLTPIVTEEELEQELEETQQQEVVENITQEPQNIETEEVINLETPVVQNNNIEEEKTEDELLEEYLAQTGLLNLEEIKEESETRGL